MTPAALQSKGSTRSCGSVSLDVGFTLMEIIIWSNKVMSGLQEHLDTIQTTLHKQVL